MRTPNQAACTGDCKHTTDTVSFQQGLKAGRRDRKAGCYDPRVITDKDFCEAWRDGYKRGGTA